jgi:disulfide bond formation protein DsbB
MTVQLNTNRRLNALGALLAFGLMGYALYSQYFQGYEPCLLCVFQRGAMIALGITFLAAAIHAPTGYGRRLYGAGGAIVALAGVAISSRHLFLQYAAVAKPSTSCGPDGLDGLSYLVDVFGPASALHKVFFPTGNCGTIDWTFMGLSMPGWVLLWFVALGTLALVASKRG